MSVRPPRMAFRWTAGATVLVAAAGCKRREAVRTWTSCSCEYMTDRDLPGNVGFEVCSEEPEQRAMAQSCALGSGVGVVIGCTCDAPGVVPCSDRDRCKDLPGR